MRRGARAGSRDGLATTLANRISSRRSMSQVHALANLFIVLGPHLTGLVAILIVISAGAHPIGTATLSLALYAVGYTLFLAAKLSVIRQGHLVTFGSRMMSRSYRWLYRLGYMLMLGAAVLTLALLAAQKARVGRWPATPTLGRAALGERLLIQPSRPGESLGSFRRT
jgi:hypothetical protein